MTRYGLFHFPSSKAFRMTRREGSEFKLSSLVASDWARKRRVGKLEWLQRRANKVDMNQTYIAVSSAFILCVHKQGADGRVAK
jgi:hypothetical protein